MRPDKRPKFHALREMARKNAEQYNAQLEKLNGRVSQESDQAPRSTDAGR